MEGHIKKQHRGHTHKAMGAANHKDPHASAEHHAANKAHGMDRGMCGGMECSESEQGGNGEMSESEIE